MITLNGEYTDSKLVTVQNDSSPYTVTFDDIPIGADVYVRADVYDTSHSKHISSSELVELTTIGIIKTCPIVCHRWTGTSGHYTIHEGVNDISLSMTDMKTNINMGSPDKESDDGTNHIFFYQNKKYCLYIEDTAAGGSNNWIKFSEGTWRWQDDIAKTSFYMTECICADPNSDGYIVVTYPKEVLYELEATNTPYTFTSVNGTSINFLD